MFLENLIQKIILKNLKHLKNEGTNFVLNNKEELLELLKIEFKRYVDSNQEKLLDIFNKKSIEIMKELII